MRSENEIISKCQEPIFYSDASDVALANASASVRTRISEKSELNKRFSFPFPIFAFDI